MTDQERTSGRPSAIVVTCPTCGGESLYGPANPHRPFCSERCRNIDLGAWASERYRVADPGRSLDTEHPQDDLPRPENQ